MGRQFKKQVQLDDSGCHGTKDVGWEKTGNCTCKNEGWSQAVSLGWAAMDMGWKQV